MSTVDCILYEFINGYRECAGNYSLEERKAFVERFFHYDEMDGKFVVYAYTNQNIEDWAKEIYEYGLDMKTPVGKKMMEYLIHDLNHHAILSEIEEIADEVADDLKELAARDGEDGEVNGHESE